MASISKDGRGNRCIQFTGVDGKRRTIRLGKTSLKDVQSIKFRVELLDIATRTKQPIDGELADWLARTGDELYGKLAAVNLTTPRGSPILGIFMNEYIDSKKDVVLSTTLNLRMSADRLVKFFGADKPMRDVTPADADNFLIHLKTVPYESRRGQSGVYAEATRARTIKHARQFFGAAIRARLLRENPFDGISGGSESNPKRKHFITREVTARMIDECTDHEWRLIIALSRFGGLRCPSETLCLKWTDINWGADRFNVHSTKTGTRVVPIFPELRPLLTEAFEAAADGSIYVITRYRGGNTNLRTNLLRIIAEAGLTKWERLIHNLRASRQTELEAEYPSHVVCAWLGNSPEIAAKHYLQVREEDFARAAKTDAAKPDLTQNPVQAVATDGKQSSGGRAGRALDLVPNQQAMERVSKHTEALPSTAIDSCRDSNGLAEALTAGTSATSSLQLPTQFHDPSSNRLHALIFGDDDALARLSAAVYLPDAADLRVRSLAIEGGDLD